MTASTNRYTGRNKLEIFLPLSPLCNHSIIYPKPYSYSWGSYIIRGWLSAPNLCYDRGKACLISSCAGAHFKKHLLQGPPWGVTAVPARGPAKRVKRTGIECGSSPADVYIYIYIYAHIYKVNEWFVLCQDMSRLQHTETCISMGLSQSPGTR